METERDGRTSIPPKWLPLAPHLFVVMDAAHPTAGGLRHCLSDVDEVALGRGETCGIAGSDGARLVLQLRDRQVSAHHARIARRGRSWKIQDESSTNGTWVNGRRVTDHVLSDGDIIQVGQTFLRIRFALPTPEATPRLATSGPDPASGKLALTTLLPALAGELRLLERVAPAKVPVLLLGETGTGKEVVARALHAASGRSGSFVAVNCAALPVSLVEGQLFGHRKGAFSGAEREELGFVRAAHGGTLLLDEIGDLSTAAQGALLRVLQEGEVTPIGANRPVEVDVRVVAATHRPIDLMVDRGDFRHDLFARLQGFVHRLWPLAQRREDIGVIVGDILSRLGRGNDLKVSASAARALIMHAWPLNVRELVQVLSRAVALVECQVIEVEHLPFSLSEGAESSPARNEASEGLCPEDAALRADLVERLRLCQGNVAAVARQMKKATVQVYRWMQRLGIDPRAFR